MAASRRNLETIAAANRVALEGAQAVAQRHMQIAQQSMTEMTEALRGATTLEDPQAKATRQLELLKQAYEHALANMRDIGAMIQKSNDDAIALLKARFTEAMAEVEALASKAAKS